MYIFNLIRSEFLKMKHASFYKIHVCIPILGSILILIYYGKSRIEINNKIVLFFGVVSIAFPLLISIVTSQVLNIEKEAGLYKEMLSSEHGRILCFISKTIMLLICGFTSLVIAVGVFVIGLKYLYNQYSLSFIIYLKSIMIIFGCQIVIYCIHIWLNLKFNCGISMFIGSIESVLSALMMTGLGDTMWQLLPAGINIRLNQYYLQKYMSFLADNNINTQINLGVRNSIVLTSIFGIILLYWFNKYDARFKS